MLFKRIISELIDLIIFALCYWVIFLCSAFEINESNDNLILCGTFFFTFILPIVILRNTFGKNLLKVYWEKQDNLRLKLFLKYIIYFSLFSPYISLSSFFINTYSYIFNLKNEINFLEVPTLFSCLIFTDLIVFFVTLGRYHLLDFVIGVWLTHRKFIRTSWKVLGISYILFIFLISAFIYSLKKNINSKTFLNAVNLPIYPEHYPLDLFYNNKVAVLKSYSSNVITPSQPFSFLYDIKYNQKTLFLNLPIGVFWSDSIRKSICFNLLYHSLINDVFNSYKPEQTRIVLSSFKRDKFFRIYEYFYFYYYNNNFPSWGIYGGISADSTTLSSYYNLINSSRLEIGKRIQLNINEPWDSITQKITTDNTLKRKIDELLTTKYKIEANSTCFKISTSNTSVFFNRIDFSKSPLYGYINFNIPISSLKTTFSIINISNGSAEEIDENLQQLTFTRNTLSQ